MTAAELEGSAMIWSSTFFFHQREGDMIRREERWNCFCAGCTDRFAPNADTLDGFPSKEELVKEMKAKKWRVAEDGADAVCPKCVTTHANLIKAIGTNGDGMLKLANPK